MFKDDPSFDTFASLGHVDGIDEEIGILGKRRGNVQKRDFAGIGVAAENDVLEVCHVADIGVAQRPEYGVQLLVDMLVADWGQRGVAGREPFEGAKRELRTDGCEAVANAVEVVNDVRKA